MKPGKGLALAVAGVAVAVFGLSMLLAALIPNSGVFQETGYSTLGILVAAVGMVLSLAAALTIREPA